MNCKILCGLLMKALYTNIHNSNIYKCTGMSSPLAQLYLKFCVAKNTWEKSFYFFIQKMIPSNCITLSLTKKNVEQ